MPIFVKIILVTATIFVLYDYDFLLINYGTMTIYFITTYFLNEWRAKIVREKSESD
jgi:ABC-type transport system involved in Fe-S cluster assembly fused permease/ATPase subunit